MPFYQLWERVRDTWILLFANSSGFEGNHLAVVSHLWPIPEAWFKWYPLSFINIWWESFLTFFCVLFGTDHSPFQRPHAVLISLGGGYWILSCSFLGASGCGSSSLMETVDPLTLISNQETEDGPIVGDWFSLEYIFCIMHQRPRLVR